MKAVSNKKNYLDDPIGTKYLQRSGREVYKTLVNPHTVRNGHLGSFECSDGYRYYEDGLWARPAANEVYPHESDILERL